MDRHRLKLSRDETVDRAASAPGVRYHERARSFYESVLGGRQVWPTGPRAAPPRLWFLVGSTLIPADPEPGADVVELFVESTAAIAERCWDAGYTVRFRTDDADDLILIDPFGRQLVLRPCGSVRPLAAGAAG